MKASRFTAMVVGGINKAKAAVVACAVAVAVAVAPTVASAEPPPLVDWAAQATTIKSDMTPAITAAIGVGFVILGIVVAYRLFRRFVH